MASRQDSRKTARFKHVAPVILEKGNSGRYYVASMYNYSSGGLYIETDFDSEPGTEVFVMLDDSPYAADLEYYRAQVKWCRNKNEADALFRYGCGLGFFEAVN